MSTQIASLGLTVSAAVTHVPSGAVCDTGSAHRDHRRTRGEDR